MCVCEALLGACFISVDGGGVIPPCAAEAQLALPTRSALQGLRAVPATSLCKVPLVLWASDVGQRQQSDKGTQLKLRCDSVQHDEQLLKSCCILVSIIDAKDTRINKKRFC